LLPVNGKIAMSGLHPTQATLRRIRLAAYRCFLPDLTGFTGRIAQDQRSAAAQTRRVLMRRHYITCLPDKSRDMLK